MGDEVELHRVNHEWGLPDSDSIWEVCDTRQTDLSGNEENMFDRVILSCEL